MSAPELKQSDTGVWYIHWTEGRRSKRVSTRSTDLASAKTFLGQWLLLEQEPQRPATLTCADIWQVYSDEYINKKIIDKDRHAYVWKNLSAFFADQPLNFVNQRLIDVYTAKRLSGEIGRAAQLSTVWLELTKLQASWNYAVKRRPPVLNAGDMPAISLPEGPKPRDRWLRDDEIEKLLNTAAADRRADRLSRVERFLWLALETAARKRSIETLRWEQIDFETKVIHYLEPSARQTSKRRVSVPISDVLLPVLRRAHDERSGPLVLDRTTRIFGDFRRITHRAGFDDVTPHVLRHTAATIMARKGVPLWLIAKLLGNSMEMVEKVYAKHSPDDLIEAVNSISSGRLRVVK